MLVSRGNLQYSVHMIHSLLLSIGVYSNDILFNTHCMTHREYWNMHTTYSQWILRNRVLLDYLGLSFDHEVQDSRNLRDPEADEGDVQLQSCFRAKRKEICIGEHFAQVADREPRFGIVSFPELQLPSCLL